MIRGAAGRAVLLVVSLSAWYSANAQDCTLGCNADTTFGVAFKHEQNMECCGAAVDNVVPAGEGFHQHGTISPAGDINGDGTEDFAVANIEGNVVYVIFGKENETPTSSMNLGSGEDGFIIHGEPDEMFGSALAGGYDVNSDGFDDLVIGSSGWMDGHGRAFIIFGSDLFPTALNLSDSASASGQFVEIRNTNQEVRECTALQGGTSVDQCPPFTSTSSGYEMNFGLSAAGVGDVNDDGLHDFLIGSNGGKVGAVLVLGRALGASWPEVIDLEDCDGETNCARLIIGDSIAGSDETPDLDWGFGMSVTGGTDFNGDGLSDMMIGSPYSYVGSGEHTGLAAVFYGTDVKYEKLTDMRTLDGATGQVYLGMMAKGSFGYAVQALGDISGDGIGDFAISAPGFAYDMHADAISGASPQPHVYVFFGFRFDEADENIRVPTILGEITADDLDGGFANPLKPAEMFTYPHNGNSKCIINGAEVSCSMGFVIAGVAGFGFGSSLAAGDLNNDDKSDLIINEAKSSDAYILWGQDHADNFTQTYSEMSNSPTPGSLCARTKDFMTVAWDPWTNGNGCGYMDLSAAVAQGEISKVTLGSPLSTLTVIGDINKDSLTDMAYLDGTTLRIIPGQCNDGTADCHTKLNLPEGCKMDLARLMVGFVDDDFIEWGRGYIRYVMEQMETEVRAAWDENMLAKGFYVKGDGDPNSNTNLRCWCSPPDQRGIEDGNWLFHCFELDDLICSKPEQLADPGGVEVHTP